MHPISVSHHKHSWILAAALLLFCLMSTPVVFAADAPLSLHPDNPHYFLFRGQPTVLITSGEHYGAVLNLDFDTVRYLDELKAHGLNLTRTFSGVYREIPGSFNIEKNTLAPLPNRFLCPWARSGVPGYKDGGNKFDLNQWDPAYLARLKDFMTEASKRGVVVELNLYCPFYSPELWTYSPMNAANNVNGVGVGTSTEAYDLKEAALTEVQENTVRKLVQELKEFDNLYYEICNEPYFGGVTAEWQKRIASVITETEQSFPHRHLISQNIANGSEVIKDPNPDVSIFNYHYGYPPDALVQNYHLNRVIGCNETGFRGSDDQTYRREGWAFILAGGGLFNNLDYSFTSDQEDGTAQQKAPGGGSRALRRQLKILQDFMQTFDFLHMTPMPAAAVQAEGQEKAEWWGLEQPGTAYALYLVGGKSATLRLKTPAGRYRVEWIVPENGQVEKSEILDHPGGEMQLASPTYAYDLALRIKKS